MAESKLHRFAGSRNVISNSFVFGYNKIGVMVYIRICHVADDFILGEISSCRYIRQGGTLIKCISIKRQRSFGRPHLVACGKPVVTALGDLLIMIQGRNSRTFGEKALTPKFPTSAASFNAQRVCVQGRVIIPPSILHCQFQ